MIRLMAIDLALALAWMRWRSFVNGVAHRRKRTGSQRLSGWLQAGSTLLVTLLGLLLAAVLGAAGFAGGALMLSGPEAQAGMGIALRVLGFMAFVMALISPLQGGGEGRSPVRLLLLPVSRAQLHASSLLASCADPLVLLAAPAVLLVVAGLAWRGAIGAAVVALPAALALCVVLVGFDALVGFGAQLLLRDRRRGEAAALVMLVGLMVVGFLPALLAGRLDDTGGDRSHARAAAGARGVEETFGAFDALPPGLFARALQRAIEGRPAASLLHAAALAATGAGLLAAAAAAHSRLLSEPGRTSRRRAVALSPRPLVRFPGTDATTVAVALAAAQTALRTVRGKIATFTPPLVGGAMALVFRSIADEGLPFASTMATATGLFAWCVALTLLNQQAFVLNAWAVDGAGFTLLALQPASDVQLVRGKMLGQGLLLLLALVPAAGVSLALGSRATAAGWASAVLAAIAAWLLHSPVGLLLSAWFPKPADMSRLSGQQPHAAAGILGALSVVAAMALPRLAGAAGSLLGGPWASVAATGLACAAAAALALPATGLAAHVLGTRREAVAMAAQGR